MHLFLPQIYKACRPWFPLSFAPNFNKQSVIAPFSVRIQALHLVVLRLDKVGKGLRLLITMVVAMVTMTIVLGSDVLHFVNATALGASLNGSFTGHLEVGAPR